MGKAKGSGAAQQYEKHPFQLSVEQLASVLNTNIEQGLSPAAAKDAQRKYGENMLSGQEGVKWYSVLLKQISNAMILVSACPYTSYRGN